MATTIVKVEFATSAAQKKKIKSAARKQQISAAEWLRQTVKKALKA